uniref:Uncharacterized protein n=1 Tax=Globodera rostochiensis TaxID=31243 RepID=A0A914I634_GLORO
MFGIRRATARRAKRQRPKACRNLLVHSRHPCRESLQRWDQQDPPKIILAGFGHQPAALNAHIKALE